MLDGAKNFQGFVLRQLRQDTVVHVQLQSFHEVLVGGTTQVDQDFKRRLRIHAAKVEKVEHMAEHGRRNVSDLDLARRALQHLSFTRQHVFEVLRGQGKDTFVSRKLFSFD